MKIRNDFVTNSSSSSFILAFKNKEEGISKISELLSEHDEQSVVELLKDFIETAPISPECFKNHVKDDVEDQAYYSMSIGDGGWWSRSKPTFENLWMKNHPGATYKDYRESEEYKVELARRTNEVMDDLIKNVSERPYIVELEYGDHTGIGSMLEHEILPYCDFTVRRFSHH